MMKTRSKKISTEYIAPGVVRFRSNKDGLPSLKRLAKKYRLRIYSEQYEFANCYFAQKNSVRGTFRGRLVVSYKSEGR